MPQEIDTQRWDLGIDLVMGLGLKSGLSSLSVGNGVLVIHAKANQIITCDSAEVPTDVGALRRLEWLLSLNI